MSAATTRILVVLAVIFLVTAAFLTVGSQEAVCASCHAMAPYAETLGASVHQGLHCYDCHLANGYWDLPGFKSREVVVMYPRALLDADAQPRTSVRVADSACLACHESIMSRVADTRGLRIDHGACTDDGAPCDDCHADTAHAGATRWARGYVMEYCVRCHIDNGGPTECDDCHDGRLERDRLTRGPWQVTHGSEWSDTHGMGTVDYCETCHEPDKCAKCHGIPMPHPADFGRTHGQASVAPEAACETCHKQQQFCSDCHGIEMPHPSTFLPEHSTLADGTEDESCLTCHVQRDCDRCHTDHTHPGSTDGTLGDFQTSLEED